MADAEIIPIGPHRPGRRQATSSAASSPPRASRRGCAGPAQGHAARPRQRDHRRTVGDEACRRAGRSSTPWPSSGYPPLRHHRRGPPPRDPSGDLLAAFQHAAKELFGDQGDAARPVPGLPAPPDHRRLPRRRVRLRPGGHPALPDDRLRPIAEKWFRIEVRPRREHPDRGRRPGRLQPPGTVPMDGLMTMVSIHDHTGRFLRPLGADLIFRMPLVSTMARKGGAAGLHRGRRADARRRAGGVWPEGFKGIGKPYADRYKLQRFGRGGFVAAALRTGVPIIPLSVVGAGDLPARRQHPLAGAVARDALHPDHAVLPAAGAARSGSAAVEVADRVR